MYWCCAQTETRRERLASYTLALAGYEVYQPLLREQRRSRGRKIVRTPPAGNPQARASPRSGSASSVACAPTAMITSTGRIAHVRVGRSERMELLPIRTIRGTQPAHKGKG
jgi:hypothetical protein